MRFKNIKIIILYLLLLSGNQVLSQAQFSLDGATKFVLNTGTQVVLTGGTNLNNAASEIMINDGLVIISGNLQGAGSFNGTLASSLELNGTGNGFLNFSVGANMLDKLTFNRIGSAITLNTPVTISGLFTLQNGVLITSMINLPTLGTGGGATGTLNYLGGQVNGPFKRWFAALTNSGGSGDFPIGDGNTLFNPRVEFTSAPGTAGTLTAQWINTCPGFAGLPLTDGALNLVSVNPAGYWKIDAGNGLAGGTYTSGLAANNFPSINGFSTLRTVRRPAGGGNWIVNGTAGANTGSNAAPVIVRQGMTGFGEFGIAAASDNTSLSIAITCPANQSANTPSNACSAVVNYTASASGPGSPVISYEFSGATSGTGTGTGSGSVFNNGVTIVKLTATTSCEATSCEFTVTVTDNQAPALTGTLPVGQTGMPLCFADIPAGPTVADIAALYTDNCSPVVVTKSGAPTGTNINWSVTYNYTIQDNIGNVAAPFAIIYSGGTPAPGAITGLTSICNLPDSAMYSIAPVAGASSYVWTVSSSTMSIVLGQGTTSVRVKYTNQFSTGAICVAAVFNSCQGPATCLNVIKGKADAPASIAGPLFGVCNSTQSYTVAPVNGASSYNWEASIGATIISGQNTATVLVSFGSGFASTKLKVQSVNACGTSGWTQQSINAAPAAPGVISGNVTPCIGSTQTYSVTPVFGATSYTWAIPNGYSIVGPANNHSVMIVIGPKKAKLEVQASNVCGSSSSSPKLSIEPVSCVISRNGQENQNVKSDFGVHVYPNPTETDFNIQVISTLIDPITIRIFDASGKLVSVKTRVSKSNIVKIGDDLRGGTYAAEVIQGAKRKVVKLVKLN